jgi:hypothetical protein
MSTDLVRTPYQKICRKKWLQWLMAPHYPSDRLSTNRGFALGGTWSPETAGPTHGAPDLERNGTGSARLFGWPERGMSWGGGENGSVGSEFTICSLGRGTN